MDKIMIRGLRVFAYHGVNPEEKEKGQPFELDITLEADLRRPPGGERRAAGYHQLRQGIQTGAAHDARPKG